MLLSENNIKRELKWISEHTTSIVDFLEEATIYMNDTAVSEAVYNKVTEHLKLDILDIERFVSINNCKVVSDPRAFARDNIPSDNGILSNRIFGYTQQERAGIFGYIDLHGTFIDPSCYKAWIRIDKNIRNIVHGVGTWKVNGSGEIIEDPKGETGIEFLINNIGKIKFKSTDSLKRDIKVNFLNRNRNKMFIKKYLVIPPFYRDKNTAGSSRVVGLSGINKIYTDLIVASNALEATQDYMFDASDAMKGRVQEIVLNIYDWFCGNTNKNINDKDVGTGLSGKFGILRRAAMSKTANFSSRLVITAPELKVETPEEMMVDFDKTAIPMASVITEFRDFVMFHTKRFFENEFVGTEQYPVVDKTGKVKYFTPKDPEILFSDERIKLEMERFLHGYNNRFIPVEIELEETKDKYYMAFKGRSATQEEAQKRSPEDIYRRKLTWCDIFFIACQEAIQDKHVLITRFPIDSFANQFATAIELSSTKEVEPILLDTKYGTKFYKYYPKIREEDLLTDTSNKFVDTLKMSNLYLEGIGGDYDGDQVTCRGIYTREANDEIAQNINSKQNFINFGCSPLRSSTLDAINSVYCLTKVLSDTKLTKNIEFV